MLDFKNLSYELETVLFYVMAAVTIYFVFVVFLHGVLFLIFILLDCFFFLKKETPMSNFLLSYLL